MLGQIAIRCGGGECSSLEIEEFLQDFLYPGLSLRLGKTKLFLDGFLDNAPAHFDTIDAGRAYPRGIVFALVHDEVIARSCYGEVSCEIDHLDLPYGGDYLPLGVGLGPCLTYLTSTGAAESLEAHEAAVHLLFLARLAACYIGAPIQDEGVALALAPLCLPTAEETGIAADRVVKIAVGDAACANRLCFDVHSLIIGSWYSHVNKKAAIPDLFFENSEHALFPTEDRLSFFFFQESYALGHSRDTYVSLVVDYGRPRHAPNPLVGWCELVPTALKPDHQLSALETAPIAVPYGPTLSGEAKEPAPRGTVRHLSEEVSHLGCHPGMVLVKGKGIYKCDLC